MRRWIFLGIIMVCLWALPAQSGDLEDLINGVRAHYGKAKDLTVDFSQVSLVKQMGGQQRTAAGTIYFARPDKMRWVFKAPNPKEIIADGTNLVMYYVEEKKAFRIQNAANYNVRAPMAVLTGEIDVKDSYQASLLEDAGGLARIKLEPKKPMGFSYLVLHIQRSAFTVEKIETVDAYGNTTTLTVQNQRFNTKIPPGKFIFVPGPGVEMSDSPAMDF